MSGARDDWPGAGAAGDWSAEELAEMRAGVEAVLGRPIPRHNLERWHREARRAEWPRYCQGVWLEQYARARLLGDAAALDNIGTRHFGGAAESLERPSDLLRKLDNLANVVPLRKSWQRPLPRDRGILERLQVRSAGDLPDAYQAPNELIEGLLTMPSVGVLFGRSNTGKSFLALAMAAAVAEGQPFFGRAVDGGPVVYLASEAPASITARAQAIRRVSGWGLERLFIVAAPLSFHGKAGHSDDVIEAVRNIEDQLGEPVRLVVGDTLARLSSGANENAGEDMGPIMERFERVARETGAAVLLVHHVGKDEGRGSRGWSGIHAFIDTEIEVTEKGGERLATVTKQRDLPGKNESFAFRLEVVEMGARKFGGMATTCVAVPAAGAAPSGQQRADEEAFIRCLQAARAAREAVQAKPRATAYAPRKFAGMPEAGKRSQDRLAAAMERLLARGVIVEGAPLWSGPNRHYVHGLALSGQGAESE